MEECLANRLSIILLGITTCMFILLIKRNTDINIKDYTGYFSLNMLLSKSLKYPYEFNLTEMVEEDTDLVQSIPESHLSDQKFVKYVLYSSSSYHVNITNLTTTFKKLHFNPVFNRRLTMDDMTYTYMYNTPKGGYNTFDGQHFDVNKTLLDFLNFPMDEKEFIDLNDETVREFVFLTAASENHFEESKDGIATIQKYHPDRKIILYDIGLKPKHREEVSQLCNVEVKTLDSRFDEYTEKSIRRTFLWKPIILFETLKNYSGVFWVDASVKMENASSFLMEGIFNKLRLQTKGFILFNANEAGHTCGAATDPKMYHYLPTNQMKFMDTMMFGSGSYLVYRTRTVYNNIIHWYTLCGLDKNCLSPPDSSIDCQAEWPYMKCHRYDQSAINLLLNNFWQFRDRGHFSTSNNIFHIYRAPENLVEPKFCRPKKMKSYENTVN